MGDNARSSLGEPDSCGLGPGRTHAKGVGGCACYAPLLTSWRLFLRPGQVWNAAVADAPAPSPRAPAYSGGWAAGSAGGLSGGMWGGAATAGQQAAGSMASPSLPFPAGYFGSAGGMMDGASAMGAPGLMFLPMLQPQGWQAGAPQQFGLHAFAQQAHMQSPLHSPAKQEPLYAAPSAFQPPTAPASQQPSAQPAGGLRPIRTRATAATAAGQSGSAGGGGAGGSMPPPPPVPPAGGTGLDLAELLSPLAASLLSPLGLNGSPAGESEGEASWHKRACVAACRSPTPSRPIRPLPCACASAQTRANQISLHPSALQPHCVICCRLEGLSPEPAVHRPAGTPAVQHAGRWAGTELMGWASGCRPRLAMQLAACCATHCRVGVHGRFAAAAAVRLCMPRLNLALSTRASTLCVRLPYRLRRQRPAERPAEPHQHRQRPRRSRRRRRPRPPPPSNRGHGRHSRQR